VVLANYMIAALKMKDYLWSSISFHILFKTYSNSGNLFLYISDKKLSLSTTVNIGIQIITRLEQIHRKGFVHRDIKANNFMIGKR